MNPKFPVYIVSKGRHKSRVTSRSLELMQVPYYIVVEEQEYNSYSAVIDPKKILVLDKDYQRDYDTCDDLGETKSKGPGAARNFAWDHSISSGHAWHWVMDDNINGFFRFNRNLKVPVGSGTILKCMEDFVLRYENVAMAGPNYFKFISRKSKCKPFTMNTRIYSCNLIKNCLSFRWRGRYNEDTDISLRILKDGLCTILFNVFLQDKMNTQTVGGGNTEDFYSKEGTMPKSQMQVKLHPDCSRIVWRFGRWHHYVDYSRFKTRMKRRSAPVAPGDNYPMRLISR